MIYHDIRDCMCTVYVYVYVYRYRYNEIKYAPSAFWDMWIAGVAA